MTYCPECGSRNRKTAKFCRECGCNLRAEEVQQSRPKKSETSVVKTDVYDISGVSSGPQQSSTVQKVTRTTVHKKYIMYKKWIISIIVLMAIIAFVAMYWVFPGPYCPSWCNGKFLYYYNSYYGYDVYYPEGSDIDIVTLYTKGELNIYLPDDGSTIKLRAYDYPSNTVETLYNEFTNNILNHHFISDERGERYNYSNIQDYPHNSRFREVKYTYTYEPYGKDTTYEMSGDIMWFQGTHQNNTYIYEGQFETVVGCEDCKNLFDAMVITESFGSVFDLDYIGSME